MLLTGKVWIVTGCRSPRGIGFATARLFAQHGAAVVASDRAMNDEIAGQLRSSARADSGAEPDILEVRCDMTKADECQNLIDQALHRHGRIDGLVNVAGIVQSGSLLDIEEEELERMLAVNLKGVFRLCKSALKVFMEQGHGVIINLASAAAQRGGGLVGGAHYAASKGGIISLTKSIAREFGPHGIRANVICPAMIETSMMDELSPDRRDEIIRSIPLRRSGRPFEVAGTCLFLASDLSGYITGATVDVNGGSHIH
jgi:NAD(P)-dependent dehydrogenase (short-subunit alcohol dehydrogenase family)